jgi:hypothetical protein
MPDPGCSAIAVRQAIASHDRFRRDWSLTLRQMTQTRPRAACTAEPASRQECHAQISRFGRACALAIHPGRQLQIGGDARLAGWNVDHTA